MIKLTDHAKTAQIEIKQYMENKGYDCKLEVIVDNRGDGKRGFIDIVCYKDDDIIAIEVDNKTPRQKSIVKLKNFTATKKVVWCRNGEIYVIGETL